MVRAARVLLPDRSATYTVVGRDGLPIGVLEEFLAFLRAGDASPNTVQAYARGLAAWWALLDDRGYPWDAVPLAAVGEFLAYLRTGDLPSVARVGPEARWLAPSSRSQRMAAVYAFYDWAHAAHGIDDSRLRWRSSAHLARSGRYSPMLTGIGVGASSAAVRRPIRARRSAQRAPVLTPDQVHLLIELAGVVPRQPHDGAAQADQHVDGVVLSAHQQARGARDQLLLALLAETGLRIGEALSLRHLDWHAGRGDTPFVQVVPRQDHPHGVRVKNSTYRRVYVSDALEDAYSRYVWSLVDLGIDLDIPELSDHFVFVNVAHEPMWSPMRAESVYRIVSSVTRRSGGRLPEQWSPHWLRHTHATALLLSGCPPHVVMRRLGHADIQTTLNTYGWVTEDAQMRSLADWKKFTAGWKDLT